MPLTSGRWSSTPPHARRRSFSRSGATRAICVCAWFASIAMQPASAAQMDPLHAWVGAVTPASLKSWTDSHIAKYQSLIAKVTADSTPRTIDATFAPYDEAVGELALADSQMRLMQN